MIRMILVMTSLLEEDKAKVIMKILILSTRKKNP